MTTFNTRVSLLSGLTVSLMNIALVHRPAGTNDAVITLRSGLTLPAEANSYSAFQNKELFNVNGTDGSSGDTSGYLINQYAVEYTKPDPVTAGNVLVKVEGVANALSLVSFAHADNAAVPVISFAG